MIDWHIVNQQHQHHQHRHCCHDTPRTRPHHLLILVDIPNLTWKIMTRMERSTTSCLLLLNAEATKTWKEGKEHCHLFTTTECSW
jgi:hypothetical protein